MSFTALLNHPLSPCMANEEAYAAVTRLFAALLDLADVAGAAQVTPEDGRAFHGESVTLRYGEADVIALLADPHSPHEPLKAVIDAGGDWWAYDARAGKALGRDKKIHARVAPGDVYVISLLPYEVKTLHVAVPDNVTPGRRLPVRVTIETNGPAPGAHLIHLTLQRGTAPPMAHYTQDIVSRQGEGDTYIPLALNDAPDIYTLVARDVLSGAQAKATVNVKSRTPAPPRLGFGPKGKRIS